jgi:glycosyltransferase involved in cell wall biosynthesis
MRHHAGQHKLYFIADLFGRQEVPVTVLVPDIDENRAFFADKPYVQTRFYAPGSALGDAWRKARAVREGSWSSIWVVGVGMRSFLMRSFSGRATPIIKDFDELPSMIQSIGPFRRAYLRWIEQRLIVQAHGFTCASSFLESRVRKLRPDIGNRILRLPVAISADEHRIDPDLLQRLRQGSTGRPVLLYIGSISRFYEDQLDEIIALAKALRERCSKALVRVAGSGPDLEYFKAKAAQAQVGDSLEFTGHVRRERDLASHMEAAQALLFPFPATSFNLSRCPTKAFHYAAANRPVVTNLTGEVAHLFGCSALYYPERDVEAFADRCQDAIALHGGFDNRIPFGTLTWEARASEFKEWLSGHRLLPDDVASPSPA